MKVKVTVWVDMPNPQEWTDAYGVEGAANIRADVKSCVGNAIQGASPFDGEVQAEVTWE